MARIHSYVVRYDSGFAPNPFYGYCTIATCKPTIRHSAQVGDWIIGSGSNDKAVRRGGRFVFAMRVTEAKTFREYNADPRFARKKPYRNGSRKQSCGDNIYYWSQKGSTWRQRDSFHSRPNGDLHPEHVARDTGVDRVLISEDFLYLGGLGPKIPSRLKDKTGRALCKSGIGSSAFDDPRLIDQFVTWFRGLRMNGYQGAPFEWLKLRG